MINSILLLPFRGLTRRCPVLFIYIGLITTCNLFVFQTPLSSQEEISLKILNLEINVEIEGEISGLDPSTYDKYKVILYMWRNGKWWIHPYVRGGDGKSYASIGKDGKWNITAEKHMFGATKAAAFLVIKGYKPHGSISSFKQIKYTARSGTWKIDNN